MKTVFLLLVVFQLKHFLADYPLQRRWMLGKFRDDLGFIAPLLAHVGVHAMMTLTIALAFKSIKVAVALAFFDACTHFAMDRAKASRHLFGRWSTLTRETSASATSEQWRSNDRFWWSVGFDQMVHHLTHYAIIWALLR